MAGLFDKQAKDYADARPTYPASLFSMLASLTPNHFLAWDVGAGNGQASVALAEHYETVVATDVSRQQLELAHKHRRVTYAVTPPVLSDEALHSIVGREGSVDLVTVATAVHWFDLKTFYSQAKALLRKPGGVIAVWTYHHPIVTPAVDALYKEFVESTMPYWNSKYYHWLEGYRTLPFPFQPVLPGGGGTEGNPAVTEMERQVSVDGYLGVLRSWSAVTTAKDQGVDLLNDNVVKAFRQAWGDGDETKICTCKYKLYLLEGTSQL